MADQLNEKLKKALGEPQRLEVDGFADEVMERLRYEGRRGRRRSNVLRMAAGLAAVVTIVILASVFVLNRPARTSVEISESAGRSRDTLPCYVLTGGINIPSEETNPCNVLPPFSNQG